jgi:uncharacterized protein
MMPAMGDTIRVNFGRPMPVFPLPGVILLPHAVQPLHIFEPRYQQMVTNCLDQVVDNCITTAGQIAMASFAGSEWEKDYEGQPPLRPAVCIGQIVQHESLFDGRHNILLQGVCRARIVSMSEPDGDRMYRMAKLAPLERSDEFPEELPGVRKRLHRLLSGPRLKRMCAASTVVEWIEREEVPTHALLELVGFALIKDEMVKYRLLAEADASSRAEIIVDELSGLDHLVARADRQNFKDWPKGLSWN